MAERIGIVGGTFDPIHVGHLILAVCAKEQLSLDRVLLIPNWQSPLKSTAPVADFADRLAMTQRAVNGVEGLDVSDIEGQRGGISYMIDTLRALAGEHPHARWHLILGTDALDDLPRWRDAGDIQRVATIAAVSRAGEDITPGAANVVALTMPRVDVSASDIRRRIRAGKSIDFLTPSCVVAYIRDNHLYGYRA